MCPNKTGDGRHHENVSARGRKNPDRAIKDRANIWFVEPLIRFRLIYKDNEKKEKSEEIYIIK
jgi:hypothetical protein